MKSGLISFSHFLLCEMVIRTKMSWTGGDWMCAACQHQNFKKREACQRCGYPKYGGPDVSTYLYNRTEVLAGDWYCAAMNCGAHNYASRPNCYRCGTIKNDYGGYSMMGSEGSAPPGWKTGDWICTGWVCIDILLWVKDALITFEWQQEKGP